MNTLVIVLIAAVCLIAAYALYGRWLARTWGIDPTAQTPAVRLNDGKDYVPTDGWTVFSHQFSSIAGAGPVTGAIQGGGLALAVIHVERRFADRRRGAGFGRTVASRAVSA